MIEVIINVTLSGFSTDVNSFTTIISSLRDSHREIFHERTPKECHDCSRSVHTNNINPARGDSIIEDSRKRSDRRPRLFLAGAVMI
jgi:hypothetical protein